MIATIPDLPTDRFYSKERKLIEMAKTELAEGQLCHVVVIYTGKHHFTARIGQVRERAGIRTAWVEPSVFTSTASSY